MIGSLGDGNISSGEPGAEAIPNATAAIRSAAPNRFQIIASARQPAAWRQTAHATGTAATPVMMSPQPALGANGAVRRPADQSIRNSTPRTRSTWVRMSAAIGMASTRCQRSAVPVAANAITTIGMRKAKPSAGTPKPFTGSSRSKPEARTTNVNHSAKAPMMRSRAGSGPG